MGTEVKTNTGVELCFDYLSCSFPVEFLQQLYKNIEDSPILLGHGFRGYKSSGMLFGKGRVAWSDDRKEAHLDMPAQALHYYTKGDTENVFNLIKWIYSVGGKLSRIDIAFDDRIGLVTMEQVETSVKNADWVSRARYFRVYDGGMKEGDEIVMKGKTVKIGSGSSQINLRIYDKAKEQGIEDQHWTRFELMLRDEAANGAISLLLNAYAQGTDTFALSAVGLLRGFCDFRDAQSDTNVTRRVLLKWWSDFVAAAEKLKIIRQKTIRNITKVVDWIERQVAPNLAVLKEFYGVGFPNLIQYLTFKGKERWRSVHETLLADNIRLCRMNV